jgi:uncharacterized protein (TIGR02246 family)
MAGFAGLFHDDAAFVNVAGHYLRGREEIGRVHALAHAGSFRDSSLSAKLLDGAVHAQFLRYPRQQAHGRFKIIG